jgi:hypothetical protein
MAFNPRDTGEILGDLEDNLQGKVDRLTNFTRRSFNRIFFGSVSAYLREVELRLLASQLSGYIEYAGGPVSEEDLQRLDIDNVEPEEINEYLYDEQLERLVDVVGISRNEGDNATGFIDISTAETSNVVIPDGTIVSTTPDSSGETLSFETLEEEIVPQGQEIGFDIEVRAIERGTEYNVPADSIVTFQNPPIGVRGIVDSTGMSGGEDREDNDALRERARNSIIEKPTGGTASGLVGYIATEIDDVDPKNITTTEVFEDNTVEVTVDGGSDQNVLTAIDEGKPIGVRHELIRPQTIEISVSGRLRGTDINISFVNSEIENYLLSDLNVGDDLIIDKLIQRILGSSSNILNVRKLNVTITGVSNERFTYVEGVDRYQLDYTHDGDVSSVFDSLGSVYSVSDGDYSIVDESGDGRGDTFVWETGPSNELSTGDDFFVEYSSSQPTDLVADERVQFNNTESDAYSKQIDEDKYELSVPPFPSSVQIRDPDGSDSFPYTKGTDYIVANTDGRQSETTFIYVSGKDRYELNESVQPDSVVITDESGTQYSKSTANSVGDYELIDADSDGIPETVDWGTGNGSSPNNDQSWTASYITDNGIEQSIVWQDDAQVEPSAGETFEVEYAQKVYQLENEIDIIDDNVITCNCSSGSYEYEVDFDFVDYDADGNPDSISWTSISNTPSDDEYFYVTYKTDGDIILDKQEKIDADTVELVQS